MKNLSIRLKITLWFSMILIVIVGLTFGVILSVSSTVMQKTIQDNLIETIEDNLDEVEYHSQSEHTSGDGDSDQYIEYSEGYLEIDDDFLDTVNGISTALYYEDGQLLYGENPVSIDSASYAFVDGQVRTLTVNGVVYYLLDRQLTGEHLDGLWLRGIVSQQQGSAQLSNIVMLSLYLLPFLLALAILGGFFIAGRTLRPIRKIEAAAAQIGRGQDLKKRIELTPGSDELHKLAETFNEMFERLDESFESERQFTSDVSHELRTPMSVIMAQSEYSLEQQRTPEEYEAALQIIQRQGRKMSRLIEDMLRFVRLERKSDSFAKTAVDFSELVTSVCEDMALLQERGITLSCDAEADVMIEGNRELLSRLLINLINNAYRYGHSEGYIHVKLSAAESEAVLSVQDNGVGISPEQQKKIFKRFYQIDSSRSGQGTGLGLSMVQEIAHFHDGRIQVESAVGQGSTFTLTLAKIK
ncbi:MAG: ATP-binding protein [Lachnospiraceae bacterium]